MNGDSVQANSTDFSLRNSLTFDVGLSPPGYDYSAGWRAFPSLRVGIGTSLLPNVTLSAYLDYTKYYLSFGYGTSGLSPASARRSDYAIYAALRLGGILVVGAGAYYTRSDSVYWAGPFITTPDPWGGGGISTLRFSYIFGAEYDLHMTREIFVPIGLYIRQSYGDNYGPVFLRAGVGVNF